MGIAGYFIHVRDITYFPALAYLLTGLRIALTTESPTLNSGRLRWREIVTRSYTYTDGMPQR